MWLGPKEKHLHARPPHCLRPVVVGLRRLEMARRASHTAPGSALCLSTSPMPCAPQRWPTVTSLFSHPLPLHGKLTMSLFKLHAEPPLAHSHILGFQTFTTRLSTGNSPPIFCTEAKWHFPYGKRTWTANGLKQSAPETIQGLPAGTDYVLPQILLLSNSARTLKLRSWPLTIVSCG